MTGKDPGAYRTISEVADLLEIPPHVLRFWETKFAQIKPLKRGGGRRFYRKIDVDLLQVIRRRLYDDGYTIRGVQRLLKSKGMAGLAESEQDSEATVETSADAEPFARAEVLPARQLLVRLADEIAACRSILADALPRPPASPPEAETAIPPRPA